MAGRRNRRFDAELAQRACDRFNASYPIGSAIKVWPGAIDAKPPVDVLVVKPGAYILGGHTAVVQVSGGHGCIALTHVRLDPHETSGPGRAA